jgi:hypothetical protein
MHIPVPDFDACSVLLARHRRDLEVDFDVLRPTLITIDPFRPGKHPDDRELVFS